MGEEERYGEYSLYAFLAVGLMAGVVAGLAMYGFAYPIFQSREWAAWVQAIGSVVAIAVAVWLPWSERRNKQRSEQQELHRRIDRLCEVGLFAANGAISLVNEIEGLAHIVRFPIPYGSDIDKAIERLSVVSGILSRTVDLDLADAGASIKTNLATLRLNEIARILALHGTVGDAGTPMPGMPPTLDWAGAREALNDVITHLAERRLSLPQY